MVCSVSQRWPYSAMRGGFREDNEAKLAASDFWKYHCIPFPFLGRRPLAPALLSDFMRPVLLISGLVATLWRPPAAPHTSEAAGKAPGTCRPSSIHPFFHWGFSKFH